MALSDQLTALAARAKEIEDRAAAAKTQQKSDLESDVKQARATAQSKADALQEHAKEKKGKISSWWKKLEREWNVQIASIDREVDKARAQRDAKSAQKDAERADNDAEFAIEYASAALDEAEYAVLDAELAHKEADALSAVAPN